MTEQVYESKGDEQGVERPLSRFLDVAYELSYHHAWHQFEVEQERKAGERTVAYRAISLAQLRALSKRRLLALNESGREDGGYLIAQVLDRLIEQAMAEEEALNRLIAPAP